MPESGGVGGDPESLATRWQAIQQKTSSVPEGNMVQKGFGHLWKWLSGGTNKAKEMTDIANAMSGGKINNYDDAMAARHANRRVNTLKINIDLHSKAGRIFDQVLFGNVAERAKMVDIRHYVGLQRHFFPGFEGRRGLKGVIPDGTLDTVLDLLGKSVLSPAEKRRLDAIVLRYASPTGDDVGALRDWYLKMAEKGYPAAIHLRDSRGPAGG